MLGIDIRILKRVLRYTFFVALLGWVLLSIYIGYQYVRSSATSTDSKGGTFVEGIFGNTSYLPYLRNDYQSSFYQGLLFDSCTHFSGGRYVDSDLCSITTTDNQHYSISLKKGAIWSDGTPLSLDDLYFTYNDIIRGNKWNISWLQAYAGISVSKSSDNTVEVSFLNSTQDNIKFFTNYILPQHILQEYDMDHYVSLFGVHPVYTNCTNLVTDSQDSQSLVFNLANCKNTQLNFYQVKNVGDFEVLKNTIEQDKSSIIDAYIGYETLNSYRPISLSSSKLVTLFFNTQSKRLRVRSRRGLGGLIKHNFYTTGYENFMQKNTDGLFDVFQSTGANIEDLLNHEYVEGGISRDDLLDIDVGPLTGTINFAGNDQKQVYFVETGTQWPLKLSFAAGYDKISVEYKGKLIPLSLDKKNKTAGYTLSVSAKTLGSGLNKYSFYGFVKNKKVLAGSLDVYNIIPAKTSADDTSTVSEGSGTKIQFTIIYFDTPLYNFIVERLKSIFVQAQVADNFVFERMSTPEELQGRLMAGDYDILLSVVDMENKRDFTKLFGTDEAQVNPSQYQNQRMAGLLGDYLQDGKSRTLNEINDLYSKDMPFVILGNVYNKLNIKYAITEKLWGTGTPGTTINESNWRDIIYSRLHLVDTIHIDGKKIWNWHNFVGYIKKNLQ